MSIPNSMKQPFPSDADMTPQEKQSYSEWLKEAYNNGYERWMPWLEDQYLKWFGKGDNKASYAAKDSLSKTKITGVDQVDQLQDDVNNLVGNQIGNKGLLSPAGKFASKEGVNRAERNGKDEDGSYGGSTASTFTDAGAKGIKGVGSGVVYGAQSARDLTSGGLASMKGLMSGQSENSKSET
ncbi:hypothetical protein N7466_004622 [Penicillium verhagenii]|uniref:uncharacterized protein n=1 Tax=Penicillium verhagenii TaxID=1562060 RepID=UPI002545707C|nr:uncharacterized protein N7466_004622 [Penicillium verhagenii]KAJ5935075.1 hypothetical protein N7466_004622 [Penicillium verhagenii]